MGIRGFVIVLICAIALGVVARFLGVPSVSESFAHELSSTAVGPTGPATSTAPVLEVRSSVGFTLSEIELHAGERWSVVPLEDGRCTPPGPGPWRLRAPGHAEVRSAGPTVELEPDALLEIRGRADDLDALAAAYAARPRAERVRSAAFLATERLPDRWSCAVRAAARWRGLGLGALEIAADLAGGRHIAIAWEPTPGSRCEADLEQILTDRSRAPLVLRLVAADGEPVEGGHASFASAAKAVRFRPSDRATGRNCVRIDVAPSVQPAGLSDAQGYVRFDGVGLGQTLGVLARDPLGGAWTRSTLEHDGEDVTLVLDHEGVTVSGRLALPADLSGDAASRADFHLAWRESIEGVGTGLWVSANATELRAHPIGPDGRFEIVTTGPRSGTSARWELTLDVLVARCVLASASTVTALEPAIDVGELQLERAQPWIHVPRALATAAGPGWVVPLAGDDRPQWWVRAENIDGGLDLHLVPAQGADGYVARLGTREQALLRPESPPAAFVLRESGHPDRWFRDDGGGTLEELATSAVRLELHVAGVAPTGTWSVRVELDGARLELDELGPEWLGETYSATIDAPRGARLVWGPAADSAVSLTGTRVEATIR